MSAVPWPWLLASTAVLLIAAGAGLVWLGARLSRTTTHHTDVPRGDHP